MRSGWGAVFAIVACLAVGTFASCWAPPAVAFGIAGVNLVNASYAAYADERLDWNQWLEYSPCYVAMCTSEEGVAALLHILKGAGSPLPVAVRSGRHSYEGFSSPPGALVIDVSGMKASNVAWEDNTALVTLGPGLALIDVYQLLYTMQTPFPTALVFPGGTCPGVRISGFTLGGGFGFAARFAGLAADNLHSARVVLASGEVVQATTTHNSHLLWALRGGGNGNFGVVTQLTFQLPTVNFTNNDAGVAHLSHSFGVADAAAVWFAWQNWHASGTVPDVLTSELKIDESGATLTTQAFASTADAASMLAPLLANLPTPTASSATAKTLMDAVVDYAGCSSLQLCVMKAQLTPPQQLLAWKAKSVFVNQTAPLDLATMQQTVEYFTTKNRTCCPGQFHGLLLDAYGGAIARVAPEATAFPHRSALYHIQALAYWQLGDAAGQTTTLAWLESLHGAITGGTPGTVGAYRNYPDAQIVDFQQAYWGQNVPALQQIKGEFDPDNVFRFAQSVQLP